MKINLPTAAERRKQGQDAVEAKQDTMKQIVRKYLNGPVKEAIQKAEGTSVNVEVPSGAYENDKYFYRLCDEALSPLGYKCGPSHDGGGMFSTLWVTWEKKNYRS